MGYRDSSMTDIFGQRLYRTPYLVIPRMALEAMPEDWQKRMVALLDEAEAAGGLEEADQGHGPPASQHLAQFEVAPHELEGREEDDRTAQKAQRGKGKGRRVMDRHLHHHPIIAPNQGQGGDEGKGLPARQGCGWKGSVLCHAAKRLTAPATICVPEFQPRALHGLHR